MYLHKENKETTSKLISDSLSYEEVKKHYMYLVEKIFRHRTLEERAAEFDGKLMLDGEYDWGELVGRERGDI